MPQHKQYAPSEAYDVFSQGYFWATKATEGDAVYVIFDVAQRVSRVVVATGNDDHPDDKLTFGSIELGLSLNDSLGGSTGTDRQQPVCAELTHVATFNADGKAETAADLERAFPHPVRCLKISVNVKHSNWIVFASIIIHLQKNTLSR